MSVDALSLACNIITVLDFGHKFYQTFREIYENRESDPAAAYKANELDRLAGNLKKSRETALQSGSTADQLLMVADKCVKAAADLHFEITKLVPVGSPSRTVRSWQSLASASRRTWRHKRIEELNKAFDDCQTIMQTAVLLQMFQSGEADRAMQLDEFAKLESRLQNFIQAVAQQDLQISQLLAESKSLHQGTRAVIRQEMTDLRTSQTSEGQLTQLKASLRFPEINQRYNELRTAHENSFRWLLGDSEAQHLLDPEYSGRWYNIFEDEPYDIQKMRNETSGDFKQWLTSEADSKLYWVCGKPGAGKSTLMKYLFHRMENADLIQRPHLVIRHFFWLGTSSTRSRLNDMQGMFMTLLYQLLVQGVSGQPLAATLLVQNPRLSQKYTATDWSLEELEATTQKALEIIGRQYLVFIMVDALDEHLPVSEHGELLDAIQRFEEMANVRLIVSSRRERIFDTRLARSRQLQLQTLTGPDIYHFSLSSLLKCLDFRGGRSSEFANELATGISQKAEGVFLWARLAVDSLRRGFIDGNSMNEIRDRLSDMPTELSDYFESIWKRLGEDQKRYQVVAANVFSLLICKASDLASASQFRYPELDLLNMSLALRPDDAHLLIQGEAHIEESYLLELCQETERVILSHCAGLVEFDERHEMPDCIDCAPVKIDLTISTKKYHFLHRTAKEFFQETHEGKRLVNFNDMAQDGPSFHFALAYLARLAAFRDLQHTFHRCSMRKDCDMREILLFLSNLEAASAISTEQRYSLIALAHRLYFRFSGHPDNPIFEDWAIVDKGSCIFPSIIIAAHHGHGDYVVRYLETQASRASAFPTNTYGMLFKTSLESCLNNYRAHLLNLNPGGLPLTSLRKLIRHFQACRFPSTIYHERLPTTSVVMYSGRNCLSICHQVLNMLFGITYPEHSAWRIPTSGFKKVIETALNLVKLLGTSDTALIQPILCTFCPLGKGWALRIPLFSEAEYEGGSPPEVDRINIVFEVSPIWLIRHMAQVAARAQELESLCDGLMDLVDSQCQNAHDFRRPRPVLLLGSSTSRRPVRTAALGMTYISWQGVGEIPNNRHDELSELLAGLLDESSHDHYAAFIQRLGEIWVDPSMEYLRKTKAEESLIYNGLWCSEEEERQIFKACNILSGDNDAFDGGHADFRLTVPPDGCSEQEQRLSYCLFRKHYL